MKRQRSIPYIPNPGSKGAIILYATLCVLAMFVASFGQNNQAAMLNNMLGGRDASSLSASELAAIRQALRSEKTQEDSTQTLPLAGKTGDTSMISSTLSTSNIQKIDFLDQDSVYEDYKVRYENVFFNSVLPDAFFERQGFASADYPVKPGDELVLSIWGAVEKQSVLQVDNQGKVFVQDIGLLSIAGSTLMQAEKTLRAKLQSVYAGILHGRIFISLRPQGIAPSKVFVFGNVKKPNGYNLPGDANVFLALYCAGGPNDIGSVRNIIIRRATGDTVIVDLYDLIFKGKHEGEGLLRDGDIVFVPSAEKLVSIKGDVPRQAVFELKSAENVQNLLLFAGGLNPTASHTLSVLRILENGNTEPIDFGNVKDFAEAKKDTALFFGDTVIVRKSTKPSTQYINVEGSVWFPGIYQFEKEIGVKEAIDFAGGLKEDAYTNRILIQRLNKDSSFSYLADDYSGKKKIMLEPQDNIYVFSVIELKFWDKIRLSGAVKKPVEIEWQPNISIKELIMLAGGFTKDHLPGKIIVERLKKDKDKSVDIIELDINPSLEIENRKDLIVEPGDRIIIPRDPDFYEQEIVMVEGAIENPGSYSLIKPMETIRDFFERNVILKQKAYIGGAKFFRKTATGNYQINLDVEKALKGKIKNKEAEILQDGDSIYVPFVSPVVFVEGEVISRGSVLYTEGWKIKDYIKAAGGFTLFADEDRILVTYADGSRASMDSAKRKPDPGSVIYVSYKEPPQPVQWTQVVSAFGTVVTGVAAFLIAWATFSN